MKKLLIVPALLILATSLAAENRFFLSAGASFLRPADEGYRVVYGSQVVCPELSAAIRVVGGVCVTGSLGRFSKNGATSDLGLETRASQSYFSLGLSYLLRISRMICFEAGGGLARLSFREEAFGAEVSGKHSGFKVEGGVLLIPEEERVFMGLKVGYVSGRVPGSEFDPAVPQSVRLGGFKIAVSVGIQLFGND
jgi:hypothetical protein